jgi:pantoate--beta-alanine ligase
MTIIHQPATLLDFIYKQKEQDLTIGFVPTMGALHEGHINLVRAAAEKSDVTVCSIFVNPTQFNDPGDFRKYPNRLENDVRLLTEAGTNVLFLPPVDAIYAKGTDGLEKYDLGYLETILEGKFRPGHFQGVCQVMARLLQAVKPDKLFMGQKDYQQCMVVKKLLSLLGMKVEFIVCPTVREPDGLAMSSRNLRLNDEDRLRASEIFKTLQFIKNNIDGGNIEELKKEAAIRLESKGFKVDYVEIADSGTLESVGKHTGQQQLVALIAAFLGEVRLIDNLVL